MLWDQLMLAVHDALRTRLQPDLLMIHLGENDLVRGSVLQLLGSLCRDIPQILDLLLGVRLVWTNMLPRWVWCMAASNKALDRARRNLNQQIKKIL